MPGWQSTRPAWQRADRIRYALVDGITLRVWHPATKARGRDAMQRRARAEGRGQQVRHQNHVSPKSSGGIWREGGVLWSNGLQNPPPFRPDSTIAADAFCVLFAVAACSTRRPPIHTSTGSVDVCFVAVTSCDTSDLTRAQTLAGCGCHMKRQTAATRVVDRGAPLFVKRPLLSWHPLLALLQQNLHATCTSVVATPF